MRCTAILAGVIFAASGLARPLDAVDTSLLSTELPEVPEISVPALPEKRQIDLSGLTDLVGGVVGEVTGTLTGLIPTLVGTLNEVGAIVDGLLENVETADIDGTLEEVESILSSTIDEINAITSTAGVDISGELATVQAELSTAITEAEALVGSVQSLIGLVSVTDTLSEVESLAATLVDLLASLL
ncbi:hypothetical protein A1O7_07245 [Cladophialophora yegresii CBS 114405]|uniref:Plasma membrane fusion protein PRM1 n=1 Tax=Cladophialophora yegresii CBS 114405 TaxID=1182544 RepID=W9VXE9_9EURO|nr:uncharacterized protein A1O7_07245 [Cladophialophora yegresii CBS 114405]EXJ56901.1 hypothetical protein A1O7_07245 [Cladophialophora yegresii CBS 114405]